MIKVERMNNEKNEQEVELEVAKTENIAIGIVTIEGDYATLTYKRRLSHPREVVWKAITDPKEFAVWFKQQARVFDGRSGGEIDYVNEISGYHATGRVLVWEFLSMNGILLLVQSLLAVNLKLLFAGNL